MDVTPPSTWTITSSVSVSIELFEKTDRNVINTDHQSLALLNWCNIFSDGALKSSLGQHQPVKEVPCLYKEVKLTLFKLQKPLESPIKNLLSICENYWVYISPWQRTIWSRFFFVWHVLLYIRCTSKKGNKKGDPVKESRWSWIRKHDPALSEPLQISLRQKTYCGCTYSENPHTKARTPLVSLVQKPSKSHLAI